MLDYDIVEPAYCIGQEVAIGSPSTPYGYVSEDSSTVGIITAIRITMAAVTYEVLDYATGQIYMPIPEADIYEVIDLTDCCQDEEE